MNALALPKNVRLERRTAHFPDSLAESDWKKLGPLAHRFQDDLNFFIGDWLNFGREAYQRWRKCDAEKAGAYALAQARTHHAYGTLANCASVCRAIDSRRSEHLPWSHHVIIAPLEPDAQSDWLARAAKDKMSVSDLRLAIRRASGTEAEAEPNPPDPDFPAWIWDAQRWIARQQPEDWTNIRRMAFAAQCAPFLRGLKLLTTLDEHR